MTSHPSVVLGVERYVHLAFKQGALTNELFSKENFFQIKPGQTFYDNLSGFNPYYDVALRNFDSAKIIGDKSPPFYKIYDDIDASFESCHVMCIIRNIYDVAASYQRRALNPDDKTWDASRDYRRAVTDWQESLLKTKQFLNKLNRRAQLIIISYEDLFTERCDLSTIFSPLRLKVDSEVSKRYEGLMRRSGQLEAGRGDLLTSAQRNYISLHAPFGLYRELHKSRLPLSASS